MDNDTARSTIQQALDLYYCRELMDEPMSDDELLERMVQILERT